MPEKTIPAFPNSFPYNELLLTGKLSAKTRNWSWKHSGLTLLYTSTSVAKEVADAYGLNIKDRTTMVLVGVGNLVPVRPVTRAEERQIEREFANGGEQYVYAGEYLYKFEELKRFETPISFKPPQGAVRTFRVPVSLVRSALKKIGIKV